MKMIWNYLRSLQIRWKVLVHHWRTMCSPHWTRWWKAVLGLCKIGPIKGYKTQASCYQYLELLQGWIRTRKKSKSANTKRLLTSSSHSSSSNFRTYSPWLTSATRWKTSKKKWNKCIRWRLTWRRIPTRRWLSSKRKWTLKCWIRLVSRPLLLTRTWKIKLRISSPNWAKCHGRLT